MEQMLVIYVAASAELRMGDAAVSAAGRLEKSYFDVLGICCPSEVPLVVKLANVRKVSVVVPPRTVIVLHDASSISQAQIGQGSKILQCKTFKYRLGRFYSV